MIVRWVSALPSD